MSLVHYFIDELDGRRPTPQHLRLLKAHHEYQARLDRFIGKTDLKSFMREKPRYTGRDK